MQGELSNVVDTTKGIPITQAEAFAGIEPAPRQWRRVEKLVSGEWVSVDFDELQPGDIMRDVDHPLAVQEVLSLPVVVADADGAFRGNKGVKVKRVN